MPKRFTYIVEHMEDEISGWPELEYKNMVHHVGKGNLWLSHVTDNVAKNPPASLEGAVFSTLPVEAIEGVDVSKILLLDPSSPTPLSPQDAEHYDYVLFGGILGDDPPQDRTRFLRERGFATRHLGKEQMTTDTAVLVSQIVLEKGIPLNEIPYIDRPVIQLRKRETCRMPFKYILENGQPKLPPGMIDLLRESNDMPLN
eukprot:jgi/Hompol1/411/HPOL_003643-RA